MLEEQDCLEDINHVMEDPGVGQTVQQRRDHETYQHQTFADAALHVELEHDQFGAAKYLGCALVAESSSGKALDFRHNKNWNKGGKEKGKETVQGPKKNKSKCNKKEKWFGKKKDKIKLKCYNNQVLGHFA
ncbi:Uncharacterized protein Adt_39525 [Abeliophyllum distichum]|uniref:Uncharacterized protein n=1 Tax=Abeliophyllum distichum TaxID=126358 RepID=A0ABD1Q688_9LAMI